MSAATVEVLHGDDYPTLVGTAHFTRQRGRISTTFIYDTEFLSGNGIPIDPALPLVSGAQHQNGLVRAFADSAPDRWGRGPIDKAERARAYDEGRAPRRLDDLDYLLGVSDDTRQGALRFRHRGRVEFLGPRSTVPRLVSLPALLNASDAVTSDDDPSAAVKQLLDTGTTGLGGARPKASVRLEDGSLAIAKFPHSSDGWDVMAWEATALDLLERVGIRTPQRRLTTVGERSVLILRRFDRTPRGHRVGYISAMTALGASDGDHRDYADIAEAVRDLSLSPRQDHLELFDRVVAGVALGNTDDHLCNHGFLTDGTAWTLSPTFDVNPNPDLHELRSTSIMGADGFPDEVEALMAFAEECGLTKASARERISRATSSLCSWRDRARTHGIPAREVTMMADAVTPRLDAVSRLVT